MSLGRTETVLVYRALRGQRTYRDPGAHAYDQQQRVRVLRRLRHRADGLGFDLVARATGEIQDATPA